MTSCVDAAHGQQPNIPDDESTATAQAAFVQVVAPTTPVPGEVRRGWFVSLLAAS
jgi:hypothetical protein